MKKSYSLPILLSPCLSTFLLTLPIHGITTVYKMLNLCFRLH